MSKSIAIFGGSGFIGKKICQTGIALGYNVTSFSRSGKPPVQDPKSATWVDKVNWEQGNIFDPSTYELKLKGQTAVIHSIGLLFENLDYKKSMNSNFNFLNDIQNLSNFIKGPNPMKKDKFSTYEAIQRDSAVILADAYLKQQSENPTFVYMSADQQIPLIPEGYINTKREAEFELACKPNLRLIFMRPGFIYDQNLPPSNNRKLLSNVLELGYDVKSGIFGDNVGLLNTLVRPPVSTDQVAKAIFDKIEDQEFSGVVPLEEIRKA